VPWRNGVPQPGWSRPAGSRAHGVLLLAHERADPDAADPAPSPADCIESAVVGASSPTEGPTIAHSPAVGVTEP